MKNLKNKKGFTLIELIVVIAILGILALFLVPQFMGYSQDAKVQVDQANARSVWSAANASLTKSEYKGASFDIKQDAIDQLGAPFKKAGITVDVEVASDKKSIKLVTYNNCTYDGKTFGADCGK